MDIYIGQHGTPKSASYKNGDLKARFLPGKLRYSPRGHWTAGWQNSPPKAKKCFAPRLGIHRSVRRHHRHPKREKETNRAGYLKFNPERLGDESITPTESEMAAAEWPSILKNRANSGVRSTSATAWRQSVPDYSTHVRTGLLWLAVVLLGEPPGSAPQRQDTELKKTRQSFGLSSSPNKLSRNQPLI